MAISFVQQSLTFTTLSATIPAGTNGNTLVLVIATNNVVPATVVSLTCANVTWAKLSSTVSGTLSNEVWFGSIAGGASGTTVTIVLSSIGAIIAGSVSEFSGVQPLGVIINSGPNSNNGNSMTAATGDYVTTLSGSLLIVATAYGDSVAPGAQPGGYSALTFDSNVTIGVQANYAVTSTAGNQTSAQWTLDAPKAWIANAGALRGTYDPVINDSVLFDSAVVGVPTVIIPRTPFQQTDAGGVVGGCGPVTATLISGSIPTGMAITVSATSLLGLTENNAKWICIDGTPTTPGTFNYVIQLEDVDGNICTWTGGVLVQATQAVGARTILCPAGTVGGTYSFQLDVNFSSQGGLLGPYVYSGLSSAVTDTWGITLAADGTFSSAFLIALNSSASGLQNIPVNFTVTGSNGSHARDGILFIKLFPPYIESNPPTPQTTTYKNAFGCPGTPMTAPGGSVGVPYSLSLIADEGTPPYASIAGGGFPPYFIFGGTLPPGLTLNNTTGIISGTPTTPGVYTFTPLVQDSAGMIGFLVWIANDEERGVTITVTDVAELTLSCNNPPQGEINVAYSHAFPATGGTLPYNFTIIAGALPTGVTLNAATGVASGIPIVAGVFNFTIQVEDADAHTVSVACSIAINGLIQYRNTGASGRGYKCTSGQIPMCLPSNEFDECLKVSGAAFEKFTRCGLMWRKSFPKYAGMKSPPWVASPFDATRLNRNARVPFSSLSTGVLTPVLTYTVPPGYAGVINQTLQIFAPTTGGTRFQDGSSQLAWYIGTNQCFMAPGFNDMKYHQGSLDLFGRVAYGAGIRIFPNQTWIYYVVSDGTPLDPDGLVICGFNGWLYPIHG